MNNDLISRSELIKTIKSTDTTYNPHFTILLNSLINLVNEQPTAYDADEVVEELESEYTDWTRDSGSIWRGVYLENAIDIVKRGGVDENTRNNCI